MGKTDVWQGTLALMILKTLETLGAQHGYGIARRIEQTSGQMLLVNYGTLYPALLKLEQGGYVASEWGVSDNNRRAKFYRLTRAGRKQVERALAERNPERFVPRYGMVMFRRLPYTVAQARGAVQSRILSELTKGRARLDEIDLARGNALVLDSLAPL